MFKNSWWKKFLKAKKKYEFEVKNVLQINFSYKFEKVKKSTKRILSDVNLKNLTWLV